MRSLRHYSLLLWLTLCVGWTAASAAPQSTAQSEFLANYEHQEFNYFWQEADPQTGLVKDRANNFTGDHYKVGSMAATGFGLTALTIGSERGWITRQQAYDRANLTLRFCEAKMQQQHGWYFHFVDIRTGERAWQSEVSSVDTGFFLAGALLVGAYFQNTEVERLATKIYERVDFGWMLTDGGTKPQEQLLCHGWTPEKGFLPYRWNSYCELILLYLLAVGSPTHPVPASCWNAWARPMGEYAGHRTYAVGPLFTHQFSQAFINLQGQRDNAGYDYWQSSIEATEANRQYCLDQSARFHTYSDNGWGLSACDGPDGYRAYGAPPGQPVVDGTVAPLAAVAAIVFTPQLTLSALQYMQAAYGAKLHGRYGFSDAFNVDRNWFDSDVIGIDAGCALLMLENYRTGLVWRLTGKIKPLQAARKSVGFGVN